MQKAMFIMMGSMMMAAISPGCAANRRSTAGRLLNGATSVASEVPLSTPALDTTGVGFSGSPNSMTLRFHTDGDGIVAAVIAAFHLDDLAAAGGGARQAQGVHGDFRTAVAEADHIHRVARADFVGQFQFHAVRHPEEGAEFAAARQRPS